MYSTLKFTKEEELECFKKYYQSGNLQDLERLFLSLTGIFKKQLIKYSKVLNIEFDDLQQQFLLAAVKGINSFKIEEQGTRFSTYAQAILKSVVCHINKENESMSRKIHQYTLTNWMGAGESMEEGGDLINFDDSLKDEITPTPDQVLIYETTMGRINELLESNSSYRTAFNDYISGNKKGTRFSRASKVFRLRKKLKEVLKC